MKNLISFPIYSENLVQYRDMEDLRQELREMRCDGIEGLWDFEDFPKSFPTELVTGYHLIFFPDWLDFYCGNQQALLRKFGSLDAVRQFYGGDSRRDMLTQYRDDFARAEQLGVKYVVFHVSDVSIEEGYTYNWLHSSREVIEAAVELLNTLLSEKDWPFEVLVENLWWPGFTFTAPDETTRLLDGIHFPRKGIMLDIGHLMSTNRQLRTQSEGAAYIHRMLDEHKDLAQQIRGIHLHHSLSGEYVASHTGTLPADLPRDYMERFMYSYGHIQQIDQHRPWTDPCVCELVERIAPEYLVHELPSFSRVDRRNAVETQMSTLMAKGKKL